MSTALKIGVSRFLFLTLIKSFLSPFSPMMNLHMPMNPLEAARCKGVFPLSLVDLSALSSLNFPLPSCLKIASTRMLTSSTFPSFTATCSAVPLLSLIMTLWYSLSFSYALITCFHLSSNTNSLKCVISYQSVTWTIKYYDLICLKDVKDLIWPTSISDIN